MARLITAYSAHPWRRYADASIVHDRSCRIWRGGGCDCAPEVMIHMPAGELVEVGHDGGVKRTTRPLTGSCLTIKGIATIWRI